MGAPIEVREVPEMNLACLEHIGPFHLIGPKFSELGKWVAENAVPAREALAIWHSDPETTSEEDLRSEACMVVPNGYRAEDPGMTMGTIPAGEYAVLTHLGDYSGLGDAWSTFMSSIESATGRPPRAGTYFEMYMNDCSQVPPHEVRTDLYAPVGEAAR
ncbi:MAG: GyrI-like domain-containing protein [Armatimonadetes bacterium]|nr:GyrI-like domain-containing protein [Armatimonadota bacterium]